MLAVSFILSLLLNFAPPASFEASWTQLRHSPLLTEDLQSSGTIVLREPSYLRWEVKEPVQSVTEFGADDSPRSRFRMPTEKDFKVTEEGEDPLTLPYAHGKGFQSDRGRGGNRCPGAHQKGFTADVPPYNGNS